MRICLLTLFAVLFSSLCWADDPPGPVPVAATIVAPKEVEGTGKRDDPYIFTAETRCLLRLVWATGKADWDTDDAPADIEQLDTALVFSLAVPGSYQVINKGPDYCRCWFEIKGPNGPPAPEDAITRRVKVALLGHPDDASKFGAVCSELAKALDAGSISRLAAMESSMKAGLDAVGWVPGKYPDLSALAGELFGAGVVDRALTSDDRATFARQLRTISEACQGVK